MSGVLNVLLAAASGVVSAGDGGSFTDNDTGALGSVGVTLLLKSDGTATINTTSAAGSVESWDWITPTYFAPGSYKAKVTVSSGSFSTGTTGSSVSLSSTQTWSVVSSGASKSVSFTLAIEDSNGTTLDSANYTFTADAA